MDAGYFILHTYVCGTMVIFTSCSHLETTLCIIHTSDPTFIIATSEQPNSSPLPHSDSEDASRPGKLPERQSSCVSTEQRSPHACRTGAVFRLANCNNAFHLADDAAMFLGNA
ncbi:hypothetical protein QCA50_007673 [Cerrena zonata]|uniref:Uncharacterized protein n=1 Tax=Cerrena zonata TaxID=2478898 RepID=A0AAW0GBQ3_9APHY